MRTDITSDGTFENIYISSVADEILEFSAGTINNDWDKFIGYIKPEYLPKVNYAVNEAMKSPGKIINCEIEVIKANGQSAWHYVKGKCLEKNGKHPPVFWKC